MENKWNDVLSQIKRLPRAVVAFSGGMDSTLLAKAVVYVLKEKALAVTFRGPIFPGKESHQAQKIAHQLGIKHLFCDSFILEDHSFSANPPNRCYLCKKHMLKKMRKIAEDFDCPNLLDGTNADDVVDYRPGVKAAREMGVISPLKNAGLTKKEIILLSARFGLPQTPDNACLASRIPYGEAITPAKLLQVDKAEDLLRSLGFFQCRVRHHGHTARIEVPQEAFREIIDRKKRQVISEGLNRLGFTYISLDLNGYRPGSLNKILPEVRGAK